MYETYLRLGYSKEFVEKSKNNWGLDGLTLAKAIVKATEKADKATKNRISKEWFEAYKNALQEIIYSESLLLVRKEKSIESIKQHQKKPEANKKEYEIYKFTLKQESSKKFEKPIRSITHSFSGKVLRKQTSFLSLKLDNEHKQLKQVLLLRIFDKLINDFTKL